MEFTNEEFFDMLMIYGEVLQNKRRAAKLFKERYPDRKHPPGRYFQKLADRIKCTGSVHIKPKQTRTKKKPGNEDIDVLAAIAANPQASTRTIARERGLSASKVQRILKSNGVQRSKPEPKCQQKPGPTQNQNQQARKQKRQQLQKARQSQSVPISDHSGLQMLYEQSIQSQVLYDRQRNLIGIQQKEGHFKTVPENASRNMETNAYGQLQRQQQNMLIQQPDPRRPQNFGLSAASSLFFNDIL